MNNNETIHKITVKYKDFNVTEAEVKLLINLAISFDIPQEAIYSGIQMILNNQFGISEEGLLSDAMKALTADALLKSMNN
ncbi:MAG: hypothetical protein K0R15_646 [Clostridiales bacterium]|jgi:hypothetical protein|nr:hypothetical protein [Clostridiales bacterium]